MGKITLFGDDPDIMASFKEVFARDIEAGIFEVLDSRLEDLSYHDIYVTAGNSYAVMTGGIDYVFRDMFGFNLQDSIQDMLIMGDKFPEHFIPVGDIVIVDLGEDCTLAKKLYYVPTMIVPRLAKPFDIIHCMTNVIFEFLRASEERDVTIAIPALGAGVGKLTGPQAAVAMHIGYWAGKAWYDAGKPYPENAQ